MERVKSKIIKKDGLKMQNNMLKLFIILSVLFVMFIVAFFLKFTGLKDISAISTFVIGNVSFIIYIFIRMKNISKKQIILIVSILIIELTFAFLVFLGVISVDNTNPIMLIGFIVAIPAVAVIAVIYKFITDIVKYYK
jgi:hypothetical protein